MTQKIIFHESILNIDEAQWNALQHNSPFSQFAFLAALEQSHCVDTVTGWIPLIACLYNSDELMAAIPCYIKSHSFGEYVFDWQWANAYHRHGLEYYPKVVNTIPFTPVTGDKFLSQTKTKQKDIETLFLQLLNHCDSKHYSSFHSLFLSENDTNLLKNFESIKEDNIHRHDIQYHWQNQEYQNFQDYLSNLQRKKRKNIINERHSILNKDIVIDMIEGEMLTENHWNLLYDCYQSTIALYGSRAYLNQDFFIKIAKSMPKNIVMAVAQHDDEAFACALFFKSDDGLYGRYWGSLYEVKNLHFELCYYQAIDYCIKHQLSVFEAGAQGSHKLARGLLATKTTSAHWIFHPDFARAIREYTNEESEVINRMQKEIASHGPFKPSI